MHTPKQRVLSTLRADTVSESAASVLMIADCKAPMVQKCAMAL
jgi:hypothetical protein